MDSKGNIIIGGTTSSVDFPVVNGSDMTYNSDPSDQTVHDGYLAKISPAGELLWATFLGGAGDDRVMHVAVDKQDSIVAACYTRSTDWPTRNAIQDTCGGDTDIFLVKVSSSGQILWSTYIGGEREDGSAEIAFSKNGSVLLFGWTFSESILGQEKTITGRDSDVFLAKLTPRGRLIWAKRIGGSKVDLPETLLFDKHGNLVITGTTESADFPMKNAFQTTYGGLFAMKMTAAGRTIWSTYMGEYENDFLRDAVIDSTGDLIVAGQTFSEHFPMNDSRGTTFSKGYSDDGDGFIVALTPDGQMSWGRYLGGHGNDEILSVEISPEGGLVVSGNCSGDFCGDRPVAGGTDAFVAKLTVTGDLSWIRLIGGNHDEFCNTTVVDGLGIICAVGSTESWPVDTSNGFCNAFSGNRNALIVRIAPDGGLASTSLMGGHDDSSLTTVFVDGNGIVSAVGNTRANDFPVLNAFQGVFGGPLDDVFFARIDFHTPLFTCIAPACGEKVADTPTFRFGMQPTVTRRRIAFCGDESFGAPKSAPGRAPRIVRVALKKGSTSWTPSARQWRALKKLALAEGTLYWRLDGRNTSNAAVSSPAQLIHW